MVPDDPTSPKRPARLSFGALMRQYRLRAGLRQRELAERLGDPKKETYISKWERLQDPVVPSRDILERIAEIFKLSEDERLELFIAAERVPETVERFLMRERPDALRLYRSLSQLPAERQDEVLARLINEVQRDLASASGERPETATPDDEHEPRGGA